MFLAFWAPPLSVGQVATRTPPFGSFAGGPFDTVDLANLNVQFGVPTFQKAGRGIPFHYLMSYESSVWVPTVVGSSTTWQPVNNNWGWRAQSEALTGSVTVQNTTGSCWFTDPNSGLRYKIHYPTTTYRGYTDPGGTFHSMYIVTTPGDSQCDTPVPPTYSGSASAVDGSGYLMTVNEQANPKIVVTTRSGWTIPNPGTSTGTVVDSNGNKITTSVNGTTTTFFDTLSSTTPLLTVSSPNSSTTTYSYTAPSGATATFTFNYTQKTVQTNFGCSGISEYPATQVYLLTSVSLPDSTSYRFTYEQTPGKAAGIVTGRIASVTLSTGGAISYGYSGGGNGITCADGTTANLQRTTPDGVWMYTHTESGSAWSTTVTDPQGNQTVVNFQGIYETQRQVNQLVNGTQVLLSTLVTCYNGNMTNCNNTTITLPITRRTMWQQLPNSAGLQSKTDTFYNSYGLRTEVDQYAYGNGAPGSLLRKTLLTYGSWNGSSCVALGNNIVDRPCQSKVQDGGGHTLAQTNYSYDESTPTATSGVPQHVSVTGSRGNLTTISSLTAGSSFLSRHSTYYDTGTVNVATDVNGAQTTFHYGSNSCGQSFSDSLSLPLNLTRSMTYNCTGGVLTSATDENGNTTYTNYTRDPDFWRPESSQDAAGNVTNFTYTGQTEVESALNFNSGNSTVDVLSVLDGLGRASLSQRRQSPASSTLDSVQQTYDSLGRPYQVTMPYAAAVGTVAPGGTPVTTTHYDALNRPSQVTDGGGGTTNVTYTKNDVLTDVVSTGENDKRKQLEYDALGRLTSVCEITTSAPSGACGQTNAQNGYLTTYAYDTTTVNSTLYNRTTVTQNGQPSGTIQTRVYLYDLLGRLTSETNPETSNLATTYIYDSDSTCGTSGGDLVKETDANGNVICYQYDGLHRVSSLTYSGPNAAATPTKTFVYDTTTFTCSNGANVKGRLAEAYTGPSNTKITDLAYCYSRRGEVTDVYESTPHSGGYYHTTGSYWANGTLASLGGLSAVPTFSTTVEGEGRISGVNASFGPSPVVSSSTYTVSGKPSYVYLGNGSSDYDRFLYDPNTDRMTQYAGWISNQWIYGNLGWNANGTLSSLTTFDPFNSVVNNKTCNYVYDDLARLASANCGSAWSQTFSYDPFGNLTKSGSLSWVPGYNSATNRYTLGGTSYDNNGNLTGDTFHSYGWNVDSQPTAVDATQLTYNALGQAVEMNNTGTITDIVYNSRRS
jgi:YD repeat-containing protein